MADPVVGPEASPDEDGAEDVEMEGDGANADDALDDVLPGFAEDAPRRTTFLDYLKSPIVQLQIGKGSSKTQLSAHQDLLTKSPFFEQKCAAFTGAARRIDLPDEDLEAMGSFLEYLYNGEYFPKRVGAEQLERDASIPDPDVTGEQLLKHARVYNLGEKFSMPALKSLAHAKIHRTTSTARGEIAYARHVYKTTSPDDTTIRGPVAAFWATRSHVLRHEAEDEFRAMCLEFPQFGFDVLSRVLDQREKRVGGPGASSASARAGAGAGAGAVGDGAAGTPTPGTGRGRKRLRVSVA